MTVVGTEWESCSCSTRWGWTAARLDRDLDPPHVIPLVDAIPALPVIIRTTATFASGQLPVTQGPSSRQAAATIRPDYTG